MVSIFELYSIRETGTLLCEIIEATEILCSDIPTMAEQCYTPSSLAFKLLFGATYIQDEDLPPILESNTDTDTTELVIPSGKPLPDFTNTNTNTIEEEEEPECPPAPKKRRVCKRIFARNALILLKLFRTATTNEQINRLAKLVDMDEFKTAWPVFKGEAPSGHPLPEMWEKEART